MLTLRWVYNPTSIYLEVGLIWLLQKKIHSRHGLARLQRWYYGRAWRLGIISLRLMGHQKNMNTQELHGIEVVKTVQVSGSILANETSKGGEC